MKFFIDTANIEEIREAASLGVLDGVTTNPSLVAKEGKEFRQLLREIVRMFLEDCPRMLAQIDEAIAAGDPEGLRQTAHALKGVIANFAVPAAEEAARVLEHMGSEGEMERAEGVRAALVAEVDRLTVGLSAIVEA